MNLTVIANNSKEAEVLVLFRKMNAEEQKIIFFMMNGFAENSPAEDSASKPHLRLVSSQS